MKITRLQLRQVIREAIDLDIEPGDVILTGKFRNKRTVVKEIGEDQYGHPTINGKTILKFKIEKKLPQEKWSRISRDKLKEMKITKRQLRRIIREEAARPFPIEYYSDEFLIQEGLWDAISNFLGAIVGFFTDAWGEAEDNVRGDIKGYRSNYTSGNWKKMIKAVDPKGKGKPPKEGDVDWTDEKWAPAFFGAWLNYAPEVLKKTLSQLEGTADVENWVPPEGTKPEEWMKGDGKAALGVNKAFGELIAMVADLADAVPELDGAADTMRGMKPEDAGAAAAGIVQAVDAIAGSSAAARAEASAGKDIWEKLPHKGDIGEVTSLLTSIQSKASEIESAVKASAEEQAEAIEAAAAEVGPPAEEAKAALDDAVAEDEEAAQAAIEDNFSDFEDVEMPKVADAIAGDPSEFIAAAGLDAADPIKVADALSATGEELTSIADGEDGEEDEDLEEAKQWVALRRHINAMILHERRSRR